MKISVIIPTLNEAPLVAQAIKHAWESGADEVIVVDGGSDDETVENAESQDCLLVHTISGRGPQLNAGANAASGNILLFLHVDTRLINKACDQIRQCILDGHSCGAFRQRIDAPGLVFRLIEFGNSMRIRWLQMAYGDQGIFVKRSVFEELNGFDNIPFMEDFAFSRRLKQKHRYRLLPGPLIVNARRWQKTGAIRQTFSNWRLVWKYLSGVDPSELKYSRVR